MFVISSQRYFGFFSYEERYTNYESNKAKKMYMSPYFFLFYIRYEFIYKVRNTKSGEFATFFNKQWSKILNYVYFIMF